MMRWIPLPALLSALLLPAALLPASSARADEPPAPDASPAPAPAPRHDRGEAEQLRREVEQLAQRMAELQERLRALGGRTTAMPRFEMLRFELDGLRHEVPERAARRADAAREVFRSLIVSGPGDLARLGPQVEQAVREALASLGLQDVSWTDGALVLKDGPRLSASDMRAKLDRLRATLNDRLRALLPEADLRVEVQGQPLVSVEGGFAERAYVAPDVAPSREGDETAAQHLLEDALRQLQAKGLPPAQQEAVRAQLEAARAQLEAALQARRMVAPGRPPSDPMLPDLRRPPAELRVRLPDSRVEAKLLGPDGQPLPGALVAPRAALPVPAGPPPAGAELAEALKGLSEAVRALREDVRALKESLVRPGGPASGPR